MDLAKVQDCASRASIWIIVMSQVVYVLPYAETVMFYRFGLLISIVMLLYSLKRNILTRTECIILVGLIVVPVIWFVLQAAIISNMQILMTAIVYTLFVLSGFALYRYTSLEYICRILRIFVIINLFLIPVWYVAGDVEYYMPEDPRLNGSMVINWHNVYQKVVIYDEDGLFLRSAGFTRNPNNLAFLAFIGTVGLFLRKRTSFQIISWGIVLFILFFMTQSRGAFFSIVLFILTVSLGYIKSLIKKMALIFTVLAGGGLLLFLMSSVRVGNDVSSGRTSHWEAALSTVDYGGLNIYIGIGLNQSFEKLSGVLSGLSYGVDSTPITLLIEHGIIGSLILLVSFGAIVVYSYFLKRQSKSLGDTRIFVAFFIVWSVYSIFETVLYRNTFYQTILTFMIISFASKKAFQEAK